MDSSLNPSPLVSASGVYKKFNRSLSARLALAVLDGLSRILRMRPRSELHPSEFWALENVSLQVEAGRCVGIIGPNGAGKSTLLKLIARRWLPDGGSISTRGRVVEISPNGMPMQPLLTARENIYHHAVTLGVEPGGIPEFVEAVAGFAEIHKALDRPLKTFSDGMYARLQFALATAIPGDVLLIDEALAVGDLAFQIRCLDRINELKENGVAVILVSHSDMHIRYVADHCLLLFDGKQTAFGDVDEVFRRYYHKVGISASKLKSLYTLHTSRPDAVSGLALKTLALAEDMDATTGSACLRCTVGVSASTPLAPVHVRAGIATLDNQLLLSLDTEALGNALELDAGSSLVQLLVPLLNLGSGRYRATVEFRAGDRVMASESGIFEYRSSATGEACDVPFRVSVKTD